MLCLYRLRRLSTTLLSRRSLASSSSSTHFIFHEPNLDDSHNNELSYFDRPFFDYLPTESVDYLIHTVHDSTQLSWCASLATVALIVRLPFLPLQIKSLYEAAKLHRCFPVLQSLKQQCIPRFSIENVREYWRRSRPVLIEYGYSSWFRWGPILQLPAIVGLLLCCRRTLFTSEAIAMSSEAEFLLNSDPTQVFPLISLGITYINLLLALNLMPKPSMIHNIFNYGTYFPPIMYLVLRDAPVGVFYVWIASALYGTVYLLAVNTKTVRTIVGLPYDPNRSPLNFKSTIGPRLPTKPKDPTL